MIKVTKAARTKYYKNGTVRTDNILIYGDRKYTNHIYRDGKRSKSEREKDNLTHQLRKLDDLMHPGKIRFRFFITLTVAHQYQDALKLWNLARCFLENIAANDNHFRYIFVVGRRNKNQNYHVHVLSTKKIDISEWYSGEYASPAAHNDACQIKIPEIEDPKTGINDDYERIVAYILEHVPEGYLYRRKEGVRTPHFPAHWNHGTVAKHKSSISIEPLTEEAKAGAPMAEQPMAEQPMAEQDSISTADPYNETAYQPADTVSANDELSGSECPCIYSSTTSSDTIPGHKKQDDIRSVTSKCFYTLQSLATTTFGLISFAFNKYITHARTHRFSLAKFFDFKKGG